MNTAQTVFTQGGQTARQTTILPWIIGGVVALVLLFVVMKL